MIHEGYQLEPGEIRLAVEWLKIRAPDEPVSLNIALKRAARAQQDEAKDLANRPLESKGKRSDLIEARAAKAQAIDAQDHLDYNKCDDVNQVQRRKRSAPTGNSAAAAMRRLRKDRPDIHARVLAGEMSANAGMVEAGFRQRRERKKTTPLKRILKLLPSLSDADRAVLRQTLDATPDAILSQIA
jgi:hypothetical protein